MPTISPKLVDDLWGLLEAQAPLVARKHSPRDVRAWCEYTLPELKAYRYTNHRKAMFNWLKRAIRTGKILDEFAAAKLAAEQKGISERMEAAEARDRGRVEVVLNRSQLFTNVSR